MEPSPYLPTTRRFVNPIYLRVEDIREVRLRRRGRRAPLIEWQADGARALEHAPTCSTATPSGRAKRPALRDRLRPAPRRPARQARVRGLRAPARATGLRRLRDLVRAGRGARAALARLARATLQDPRSPAVRADARASWPTGSTSTVAAVGARRAARRGAAGGARAPGWRSASSTTWPSACTPRAPTPGRCPTCSPAASPSGRRRTRSTSRARTGASRRGGRTGSQELGYAPYRDMLRTVLRHAGGHPGRPRHRAVPAVVGARRDAPRTRAPTSATTTRRWSASSRWRRTGPAPSSSARTSARSSRGSATTCASAGMLGTSILWFERDGEGRPLPPEAWRELCLATVTTHDLPPTAGYLAGEHVELRERARPADPPGGARSAQADAAEPEAVLLDLLRERGLLRRRRHRAATWSRRCTGSSPGRRPGCSGCRAGRRRRRPARQNQPGTDEEYPNWRLPLADGRTASRCCSRT